MDNLTLALALLLGAGFAIAKLGQLFRLPSVTGYIVAGIFLGPAGLNFIKAEMVDERLAHFIQMALMLITFGIGEHLELGRLRYKARRLSFIGLAEVGGAFLLVAAGSFLVFFFSGLGDPAWQTTDLAALALLLGTVSVATAPASTLHVMREIKAAGPLTTILLAVVAIDNGLAIMLFGIAVSVAHHLAGAADTAVLTALVAGLFDIASALLLGVATGLLIDFLVNRLHHRSEMLTIGLALLLLCGESARMLGLSPLLAGMAAGFTLVNRDCRDVRLFRVLNAFEPPIYVLFFTLAGAHLDFSSLRVAGWMGLVYFCCRGLGKILGAWLGARWAGSSRAIRQNLGLALLPQAGVAIGLIFLIQGEPALAEYAAVITPVVLAGVVLSELAGPMTARLAVERAGEAAKPLAKAAAPDQAGSGPPTYEEVRIVPWTWERLQPAARPEGVVLFGAAHLDTVQGLARMATLLAHHHRARPLAVRVLPPAMQEAHEPLPQENPALFVAEEEVRRLGYELETVVVQAEDVASGLLTVAASTKTRAIILGHPLKPTVQGFQCVVEAVAAAAPCQVVVVRFAGLLHTERILVPVVSLRELSTVREMVHGLSGVGKHRLKLLYLLSAGATEAEIQNRRRQLQLWLGKEKLTSFARARVAATEARLQTIVEEAGRHDLLVMAAGQTQGLQKLFFGSLAESVAQHCRKPILIVHGGPKG